MSTRFNLVPLLQYINPDESYETWINVGMALKREGYPLSIWDSWSRKGQKYHDGECEKKWASFTEDTATLVTGATITQLAKDRGWKSGSGESVPFDAVLTDDDLLVINPEYVDAEDFREPTKEAWKPLDDLINYLNALFRPDEHVAYVTGSIQRDDGKYIPAGTGNFRSTAREIIDSIKKYRRLDMAIGSTNPEAGAWIRINPMDGEGCRNANVADYRYALVECDSIPIGKQLAMIKELQLPAAAIVYSGGKSIHAIVHIDADTASEYRMRVDRLYKLCKQNGLPVDTQNKNPSRLSRLPGVMRGSHKQFLIGTNLGQPNYNAWIDWMQEQADDLPEFDDYQELENDLPPLAPELICGVLRQGHKMLITGPSKAGKSFALIELAIAIVEGKKWFGFQCMPGNVLYINLEIDRASCLHRIHDVYQALGLKEQKKHKLMVWNLRGEAIPLDKLAPKIIRKAQKYDFRAVIVDPIYKVITGDENAAGDMAKFCNNFDVLCKQLGVSCIYCHHHSKGAQGGKKAQDRGSGSGVFARDPDALIDINPVEAYDEKTGRKNGFKVSGVLREFPPLSPFGVYFDWPIHKMDDTGVLDMAAEEGSLKGNQQKGRNAQTERKLSRQEKAEQIIKEKLAAGEEITQTNLLDKLGVKDIKTVRGYINNINKANKETGGPIYSKDNRGRIYIENSKD